MSAESGISTFRDSGGLWEEYDVMKVAHINSWQENKSLMLRFYNERRQQLASVKPNKGHMLLAGLEDFFKVTIITQNVDNLHERAGSSKVIHLHGELTKACSSIDKSHITDIGYADIKDGDKADDGSQLRPFIVWFGEAVPEIDTATKIVSKADILVIIGTSMQVYPAAGLIHCAPPSTPIYLIDPSDVNAPPSVKVIKEKASKGLEILIKKSII